MTKEKSVRLGFRQVEYPFEYPLPVPDKLEYAFPEISKSEISSNGPTKIKLKNLKSQGTLEARAGDTVSVTLKKGVYHMHGLGGIFIVDNQGFPGEIGDEVYGKVIGKFEVDDLGPGIAIKTEKGKVYVYENAIVAYKTKRSEKPLAA